MQPLLGCRQPVSGGEKTWRSSSRSSTPNILCSHCDAEAEGVKTLGEASLLVSPATTIQCISIYEKNHIVNFNIFSCFPKAPKFEIALNIEKHSPCHNTSSSVCSHWAGKLNIAILWQHFKFYVSFCKLNSLKCQFWNGRKIWQICQSKHISKLRNTEILRRKGSMWLVVASVRSPNL